MGALSHAPMDFSTMEFLDGDDEKDKGKMMVDGEGQVLQRDIC